MTGPVQPASLEPLVGAALCSTADAAHIRGIHRQEGVDWSQVVWLDHSDLPSPEQLHRALGDLPLIAEDQVLYRGEPLLLLAAPTPALLEDALRSIIVEYDGQEPVLTIEGSLAAYRTLYADDNVYERYDFSCGNVLRPFADAAFVREDKLRIGVAEPPFASAPIVIAAPTGDGGMALSGDPGLPADPVRRLLADLLGMRRDQVRLVSDLGDASLRLDAASAPATPSSTWPPHWPASWPQLVALAALLARKADRAVRLQHPSGADTPVPGQRHPGIVRHLTAFAADGRMLARDILVFLDGGAAGVTSREVLQRALLHAAGPYSCPNMRLRGRVMASNSPSYGAPPADGILQMAFAGEVHLQCAAVEMGLDPADLRRINLLDDGERPALAPRISQPLRPRQVLDLALERSGYADATTRAGATAAREEGSSQPLDTPRRGVGLALVLAGEPPVGVELERLFAGDDAIDFACAAHVVEVEVEPVTGVVGVRSVTAAADLGPLSAAAASSARFEAGFAAALELGYRAARPESGEPPPAVRGAAGRASGAGARIELVKSSSRSLPVDERIAVELALCGMTPALLNAISQAAGCQFDTMPLAAENVAAACRRAWQPWLAVDRGRRLQT